MSTLIKKIFEPKCLVLTWRSPNPDGGYFSIAKIQRLENGNIEFSYLVDNEEYKKALSLGFKEYSAFRKEKIKYTDHVLEMFTRRLPSRKRADFKDYLKQIGIDPSVEISDFALLAYSSAKLATDNFKIINTLDDLTMPCEIIMEVAGVRYYVKDKTSINIGDSVSFKEEPTNIYDKNAIQIIHADKVIGYVSKVQCKQFKYTLKKNNVEATVLKMNGTELRPTLYLKVNIY